MGVEYVLDGAHQAPRLTAFLRAVTAKNSEPSIGQLELQRQAVLQQLARPPSSHDVHEASAATRLIGDYKTAPRASKDAYDAFLAAVAAALESPLPAAELSSYVAALWDALDSAVPQQTPDEAEDSASVRSHARKYDQEALAAAIAPILGRQPRGERIAALLATFEALRRVRREHGLGGVGGHPAGAAGALREWGQELAFDAGPTFASPDDALRALCRFGEWPSGADPASGLSGTPQQRAGPSAAVASGLAGSSAQVAPRNVSVPDFADADSDDDLDAPKRLQRTASLTWLQTLICKISGVPPPSEGGDDTMLVTVVSILVKSTGDDAAASELLELLGYDSFDDIRTLLEHRQGLLHSLSAAVAKLRAEDASAEQGGPQLGLTVAVNTASQKAQAKIDRKAAKKGQGRATGVAADFDYLQTAGWAAVQDTEVDYSNILNLGGVEFKIGREGAGGRKALPAGTKRTVYKNWEEFCVPAVAAGGLAASERLVAISELDDWAQVAFEGYKSFNRIQSRIFPVGYHTNENMLVSAPTGAGKTNIAMITVLHEIGLNRAHGVIQRNDFKIVYVAPMKALAAEMARNFGGRLEKLGIQVRELTGDMQLTKKELSETQMIVTTPEKWDVITRKGGDVSMASLVRLLIIDEVHLLNDERGPVIETLISRTLRQVESSQSMIRIVGLSATLPNYEDVATFLGVNKSIGLFYFGPEFRPVPLAMNFVGISEKNVIARNNLQVEIVYNRVRDSLRAGHQCMIFVHSRKDTGKTAEALAMYAAREGESDLFAPDEAHPRLDLVRKEVGKSRNAQLKELFDSGFAVHHAGMLRSDRNLVERLFSDGHVKVLCCTATLAWGVNLPAHTVIIKGTQVYDASKGKFTDLSVLDVQQIFGRAGRPQFDSSGDATIVTTHDKLAHYLGMLTSSTAIESQFLASLVDNLNAEIVLGTVTTVKEALTWLSYSYLQVRMARNPLAYGISWEELVADPTLERARINYVTRAAKELEACKMARFVEASGHLYVTELGRVASHYYIKHKSILVFSELLKERMQTSEVYFMIAKCSEFETLQLREEEVPELESLQRKYCTVPVRGGLSDRLGKVQILMQVFISRGNVESFSLVSDMMYVGDNAPRIARALFEIVLRRGWPTMANTMLSVCKELERRMWSTQHPLRQFDALDARLIDKMEGRGLTVERLADMSASEIGAFLSHPAKGQAIKDTLHCLPYLHLDSTVAPITRSVLRITALVRPDFVWSDRAHGQSMRWVLWVEDSENEKIYHNETWTLTKKMMGEREHRLTFTIPVMEPLPTQYYVRLISDSWLNAEAFHALSFKNVMLPVTMPPHTELLDLQPLPRSALNNAAYEEMYAGRFTHFNPIQTQAFHTLYHTDESVLLGAPTGSGKTISSELAMLRVFNEYPGDKIIYIAPLKALVRERMNDWGKGLCKRLNKRMVELTGDYTPDLAALLAADIIICTPEKWDGISRNWQSRGYVKMVRLLIIDEIHLLGSDRGPILEVIVSRMRYIAAQTARQLRFVGLSTALANAHDLGSWLGVKPQGLFNFKPSVRPVPLEAHIQGYPGKFYCPRMASMNKPAYAAIQTYSPAKPVLVFVSSRRQTRLTALDLIAFAAADMKATQWLRMNDVELESALNGIKDASLRHTLQFGIGLHHAGLSDSDRMAVEAMFCAQQIMVLVATSTLAWGVNTPTHLVIIKGTEFYDAPSKRYVDYPITDVLQMMGRAGRPQYDKSGVAVIMVHEPKKGYYKKFLYEPFPVESALPGQITDHFNAEIVSGTITSKQSAIDYLTWTYFYRRLVQNPTYYDLEGTEAEQVSLHLSELVEASLVALEDSGCVTIDEDGVIDGTTVGRICSFYYLQHATMDIFTHDIKPGMAFKELLLVLCAVPEYDELPVRHNEDKLNTVMAGQVRWPVDVRLCDDPHIKANLLLQAHFARLPLPIADYVTDTRGVLDQSIRILQAMVDVSADAGWLPNVLTTISMVQAVLQGRWHDDPSTMQLPHVDADVARALAAAGYAELAPLVRDAVHARAKAAAGLRAAKLSASEVSDCLQVAERLPIVDVHVGTPQRVRARAQSGVDGVDAEAAEDADAPEEHFRLHVDLRRHAGLATTGRGGGAAAAGSRARVYAPRYPKVKEEGWYLLLGARGSNELLALKRVGVPIGQKLTTSLIFPLKDAAGQPINEVSLFLKSDSYQGLDREVVVRVSG